MFEMDTITISYTYSVVLMYLHRCSFRINNHTGLLATYQYCLLYTNTFVHGDKYFNWLIASNLSKYMKLMKMMTSESV